jgi:small-conductance mechanosensitive channel
MDIPISLDAVGDKLLRWLPGTLSFLVAMGVGLVLQSAVTRLLARWAGGDRPRPVLVPFLARIRPVSRYAVVIVAATLAFPALPLPGEVGRLLHNLLIAGTIVLVGWIVLVGANTVLDGVAGRLRMDVADNLDARKAATQLRVLKTAADTMIVLVTLGLALMSFPSIEQFGLSLFASAGVAGLVLGLAARPLLENLLAGVQLALTQPIRIDDVLVIQGQWGWVEEINATYVVMRLWDRRRFVLPLSYFLQNPFENWTRTSSEIIGSVFIHLDYTAPVAAIRAKAEEIVRASRLWNGNVVNLQVTDATADAIVLRVLVTAADSPSVWDLRCEVREKLLAYVQAEHPGALPRRRLEWDGAAPEVRA